MNNYFPILAIESSGNLCSTAVLINENEYAENNIVGKHVHSEKLQSSVDYTLKSAGLEIADIKLIAVSVGPGSFTGLRIGMSVAKGLGFGINIPIVAVPTLDAYALQVSSELKSGQSFIVANSVNQDEIYIADYKKEEELFSIVNEVRLQNKKEFNHAEYSESVLFGDFVNKNKLIQSTPNALFIARWAYFFGKDLVTSDYDLLEPNYIKNFIAKVKK